MPLFIAISLTTARWLVPAEATAEGETLWIALLWFLAGIIGCILLRPRDTVTGKKAQALPSPHSFNFDFADLGVGFLVGGHVLSGVIVVISGGDRRAALNLSWEWLSLAVLWFVWRRLLSYAEIRRQMIPLLMTTAVTLSLWGLWQYFIWYPQIAATYGPIIQQLKAAEAVGGEVAGLRQQLIQANIPPDGPARALFEGRLLQSREPFGPFALANTYGGLLAAWLVIGVGVAASVLGVRLFPTRIQGERSGESTERSPPLPNPLPRGGGEGTMQKRSWLACIGAGGGLLLIVLALYLTNSRTAWVGAGTAFAAGFVIWFARTSNSPVVRRWLFPAAVIAGFLAGLAVLAVIFRDEHAVPGPLKSLAYRAEYWIGTVRMLRASPWLGSGLGQFRDRYPAFKVPESSEEIADPHNLLLDAWANGGLIAVAGLLGLIVLLLRHLYSAQSPPTASAGPTSQSSFSAWRLAGAGGFLLVILMPVITTGLWDEHVDRLAIFGMIWLGLSRIVPHCIGDKLDHFAEIALLAALALAVHLLGAGGLGMPAVTQFWLLLLAWGLASGEASSADALPSSNLARWGLSGVCIILAAACLLTGWRPVFTVQQELQHGDAAWSTRGNLEAAERHFRAAAAADGFSSEAWQRLAEEEFSRHEHRPGNRPRPDISTALHALDEAIRRAPDRAALRQRKGQMLAVSARISRRDEDWLAAAAAFGEAVQRHPTDALLLAEYAEALAQAKSSEAPAAARRAIGQDDLNHRRGHTDQYLPESRRREVERIESSSRE